MRNASCSELVVPAAVHVHEVHHRHDDDATCADGKKGLGRDDARRPAQRHADSGRKPTTMDFASPLPPGSKMGIDATNKWQQETTGMGTPIALTTGEAAVDAMWRGWGFKPKSSAQTFSAVTQAKARPARMSFAASRDSR